MSAIKSLLEMQDDLPFAPPAAGKPLQQAARTARAEADSSHMAGRLRSVGDVRRYVEAGNARFTVRNGATGNRFTFRAARPKPEPGQNRPIWFSVLTGQDNTADYSFIGTCWPSPNGYDRVRPGAKSRVPLDAPSAKALTWLLAVLNRAGDGEVFQKVEVWHEGRCGRCGRVLTVPESVESGFGPECAGRL